MLDSLTVFPTYLFIVPALCFVQGHSTFYSDCRQRQREKTKKEESLRLSLVAEF